MWKADAAKTSLWHPPDLCGTLEKQSRKRGDWKPRFFALKGSNLFWFTAPTAKSPKGHIPLEGAAVHSVRPPAISEYTQEHVLDNRKGGPPALFGIVILTDEGYAGSPGGRPELVVAASTPELQALWTKALQQASIPRPQLLAKLHEQSRLVDILGGYENMPAEAEGLAGGGDDGTNNPENYQHQHNAGFGNDGNMGFDADNHINSHNMMATDGSLALPHHHLASGLPGPAYPGFPRAAGYGEGEGGDTHHLNVAPRALSDSGGAGFGFMGGMNGMDGSNNGLNGGMGVMNDGVPRSSFAFAQHPSQGGGQAPWGRQGPGGDGTGTPPFSHGNDGRFNDTARDRQYPDGMGQQQYNKMMSQQYSQGGAMGAPTAPSLTRRSYDGLVANYATRSGHLNPNFNNSSNGGSSRQGGDDNGRKSPLRQRAEQLINGLRRIVSGRGGKGEDSDRTPHNPRGGPEYTTAADYYHNQLGAHHAGSMNGSQYGDMLPGGGAGYQYGGHSMGEGEWQSGGGAPPGVFLDPSMAHSNAQQHMGGGPMPARRTVDLRSAAVSEAWAGGLIPQHRGSDNGGGRATPPRPAPDVTVGGTLVHGIVGNWAMSGAVPLGSRAAGAGNGMASPRSGGGGNGAMTPRGGAAGSGLRTPSGRGTRSPAAGSDLNMFTGQQRPPSTTGQGAPNLGALRIGSGLGSGRAAGLNQLGSFNGTSTPRTTVEDVASEAASVTDRLSLASHALQQGGSGSPKAPHPSFAPMSMGVGAGGAPGPGALDALAAVQAQVAHASQLLQVHAERLERSMSSGSNEGGPAPSNMGGSNYGAAPGSNRAGIEGTSPRMAHDTGTSMGGMPNPQMGRTRRANTEWFISQFDELRQSLAAMHAMVAKGARSGNSPGSPAGPPPAMQAAPGAESEVMQQHRSRLSGYLSAVRQQLLTLQAHRASLAELRSEEAAGLEAALLSVHNALSALGGSRTNSTDSSSSYNGPAPAAAAYPHLTGSSGPGSKSPKMMSAGLHEGYVQQNEQQMAGWSPRERDVSMMSMMSNASNADTAAASRHGMGPPAMQATANLPVGAGPSPVQQRTAHLGSNSSSTAGPARTGSHNNNGISRMGQAHGGHTRNTATSHADMAVTVGADGSTFNVTAMAQRPGSVKAVQGRGASVQAQGGMRQVAGSGSSPGSWGIQHTGAGAGAGGHMNSPQFAHHLGGQGQLQLPGAPGGKGSRAGSIREAAQELRQHYMGIAASGTTTNSTAALHSGYAADTQHPMSPHARLMDSTGAGSRTGSQASDTSSVSGQYQRPQYSEQYMEQGRAGLGSLSTPLPAMPSSSSVTSSAYDSAFGGAGVNMSPLGRSPVGTAPAGGAGGGGANKAWGATAVRAIDRRARYSSTDHC